MENTIKVKKRRLSLDARNNLIGYGLIAPALVALIAIGVIPILITVSYSFQYYVLTDPLNKSFVGLDNYITLFTNPLFWRIFGNTMIFAVLSMAFELILGFAGAILMTRIRRARGLVRTAVLIPWALPGIIIAYIFSYMFNDQMGVLNSILIASGVSDTGVSMLTSGAGAMLVVVLADTWKQFPYVALMLMAGLQTISPEYYEAASMDGASRRQQFFRITLPNLKGIILIVLLFRTMGAVRIFDIIFGITGGGPSNSTSTLLYQAYKYLFGDMNFGLGSALSTIITIIILVISFIYMKVLKTDEE